MLNKDKYVVLSFLVTAAKASNLRSFTLGIQRDQSAVIRYFAGVQPMPAQALNLGTIRLEPVISSWFAARYGFDALIGQLDNAEPSTRFREALDAVAQTLAQAGELIFAERSRCDASGSLGGMPELHLDRRSGLRTPRGDSRRVGFIMSHEQLGRLKTLAGDAGLSPQQYARARIPWAALATALAKPPSPLLALNPPLQRLVLRLTIHALAIPRSSPDYSLMATGLAVDRRSIAEAIRSLGATINISALNANSSC